MHDISTKAEHITFYNKFNCWFYKALNKSQEILQVSGHSTLIAHQSNTDSCSASGRYMSKVIWLYAFHRIPFHRKQANWTLLIGQRLTLQNTKLERASWNLTTSSLTNLTKRWVSELFHPFAKLLFWVKCRTLHPWDWFRQYNPWTGPTTDWPNHGGLLCPNHC